MIDYAEIPHFPLSTVESHAGRLLCGTLGGQARRRDAGSLSPLRRVHAAAGELSRARSARAGRRYADRVQCERWSCIRMWSAGDLMLIADHINFFGDNPLVGPNDDRLGPRFPDMSAAYDAELLRSRATVAGEERIPLREGVYLALRGPSSRNARGVPHAAHARR